MKNRNKMSECAFNLTTSLIFIAIGFITIYPFYYALIYSFSNGISVLVENVVFLPVDFTLENYKAVYLNNNLLRAVHVSIARTLIGTVSFLIVTGICAYSLSKKYLVGRKIFLVYYIIPMFIGGGLLPYYIVIHKTGLTNNFLVYILPNLFNTFYMILMKVFFEGIPDSLEEAAFIDGAGTLQIFLSVYLPLSMPIVATVSLFSAVGQWNSWFDAMLFMNNTKLHPLQLILQSILKEAEASSFQQVLMLTSGTKKVSTETIRMAILIVTTFPILIVYPFLQKYFIKGMTLGAVKM